ncbi:MAG: sugar ABC transporter substrate-binding protein [Verrucomicrobiae bacterium]|nr:sugar ABC transporter substrate-binding protein [Verrucomicrobiae bacterium]
MAFWGAPEEVEIISSIIHEWEKSHPDIVVILEHGDYPNYVEKILTQVAGRAGPDVIFTDITYFYSFAAHDMFLDLTPYIAQTQPPLTARFFPEIMHQFTREGRVYCIPRDIAPITVIYYNKKAFQQVGLPPPTDDWDWAKFLDTSRRLTMRDGDRVVRYGYYGYEWANFIFSNGGSIVDNVDHPTRCTMDSPEAREALQFYYDLIYKERVAPSPATINASGMNQAQYFGSEKTAMYLSGIWETPQLLTLKTKFDWDIVPFPRGPKGLRGTRTGGSGYAILKTTTHPKEAWEVVKALAGPEAQTRMALTGLAQPADQTIALGPAWAKRQDPPKNRGMLNEAVKHIIFDPNHPKWSYFQNSIINPEIELFILGHQNLDQTVKNINVQLNTALRKSPEAAPQTR